MLTFLIRSFLILLGVLYRYQQRTFGEELEEHAADQEDLKDEIEEVCRKYWRQTKTIGHAIRLSNTQNIIPLTIKSEGRASQLPPRTPWPPSASRTGTPW